MKKLMKRGFAVVLALMMCVSMLGTTAFAAGIECPKCGGSMETKAYGCDESACTITSCTVCDYSYKSGHNWDDGIPMGDKIVYTCKNNSSHTKTEDAPKKPEEHKHDMVTKPYGCDNEYCTISSCQTPGCDHAVKNPHAWDEGRVTKEPTTTEMGEKTYTCKVCETTKTEPIPMLPPCDHQHTDVRIVKDATHTEEGKKELYCTECGKVLHTDTCPIIKDHVFVIEKEKVDPTCTEQGYTVYECKYDFCSETETRDFVDALGHLKPTVQNKGPEGHYFYCDRCNEIMEGPLENNLWDHKYSNREYIGEWETDKDDPTFEVRKYKETCLTCGYEREGWERQERGNGTLTITYVGAGEATPGVHTEEVKIGGSYSVSTPEIPGYTADVAVVSGTMESKDGVQVTVTYSPIEYTLTVRHVASDGTVLGTDESKVAYGASYSASARTFAGYNVGTTTDAASGTMTGDLTVTYTYTRTVVVPPSQEPSQQPSTQPSTSPVVPPVTPVEDINEPNVPLDNGPVDIDEPSVPLAEDPADLVDITEENVPLSDGEDLVLIDEEEVPLANVPQTGDISMIWYGVSALSACGLTAVCASKKREGEEE